MFFFRYYFFLWKVRHNHGRLKCQGMNEKKIDRPYHNAVIFNPAVRRRQRLCRVSYCWLWVFFIFYIVIFHRSSTHMVSLLCLTSHAKWAFSKEVMHDAACLSTLQCYYTWRYHIWICWIFQHLMNKKFGKRG